VRQIKLATRQLLGVHRIVSYIQYDVVRQLKPNSITLDGSELAPNRFGAGSELVRSQLRTS